MATLPNKKFRVLIVDDSAFMRKVLESILNSDDQLQVVGQAKDGREAVTLAESLKPDVITMDINMPHVDGFQATAQIMTTNPRPIVIVSSESREGAASTLKALELGAIEFVAKPSSGIDLDMQSVREDLVRKVRMSAKVRVVRTASRLASTLQAVNTGARAGNRVPRSTLSRSRPRRFHRRPGNGYAFGPRFYVWVSCRRFSGAAHASDLHNAVRGATRRVHRHPRKRSRTQRACSARHALHLSRRPAFAHHSDRPHPTRRNFRPHPRLSSEHRHYDGVRCVVCGRHDHRCGPDRNGQ